MEVWMNFMKYTAEQCFGLKKNENEGLKAQETKYSGLPRKKFRKYLKLHLEQESGHILKCNR